VFRSGYTGEDGIEIIVPAAVASQIHHLCGRSVSPASSTAGGAASKEIKPAGLGARDTLRMEAGMPLYGHELSEQIDPISAGLGWCVDLKKDFIGAEALRAIAQAGPKRKLVGLELEGRRIGRQHAIVMKDGAPTGEITSGTFSPTLQKSIAMAYVEAGAGAVGTALEIELGSQRAAARVVSLPFYKST
jgi:aminomethyltransferase